MSSAMLRTAWATALVAGAGATALALATQGFRDLTSEGARRAAVVRMPVALPALLAADQLGEVRELTVDSRPGSTARTTIVDVVYTRCETICSALGGRFQQLQAKIRERQLQTRVRLLTLSFDPANDTADAIARYALRLQAEPGLWTVARPLQPAQLPALLDALGIVVVPVLPDQFVHNAALHVLDPQGRLAAILDADDTDGALAQAISLATAHGSPR